MMTVIGVIAVLFGGSGGGYSNPFAGIASALAFLLCAGILYVYYWMSVLGILTAAEWFYGGGGKIGVEVGVFALMGPIVIPMLIASIVNGISAYRAAQARKKNAGVAQR